MLTYLPAFLCSALIPLLSLINPEQMPNSSLLHFAGADKVMHLLIYAVLTFVWIYPMPAAKRQFCNLLAIALTAGFYGALMEACQFYFTASRSMEILDATANLAGALIVAAGFYIFREQRQTKRTTNISQVE